MAAPRPGLTGAMRNMTVGGIVTMNIGSAASVQESRRTSSSERLNVMLVSTPFLPKLGADTWVHIQIMRTLDASAHRVHVGCVSRHEGNLTSVGQVVEEREDLLLVELPPGPQRWSPWTTKTRATMQMLRRVAAMARYIRRNDIRILHTTDRTRDAMLCVLMSKVTRAKSIVHVHVLYADWMSRGLRWAIQNADARIAVSAFVKESLTSAGMPSASTHVVLNAVDVSTLVPGVGRQEIRDEFGLADSQPLVVTVCRLFKEKGTEELIRAIHVVARDMPDVQLVIVGEENLDSSGHKAHLESVIAELDMGAHVRFTGRRPDVPAIMAAADVFAMPSFEEPFGLVFGEAMAMERPVVALDNGGTKEVVEHGRHGLLSERGDITTLAQNLRMLLTDEALREKMGKEGRRRVLDDFQIERLGDEAAQVYRLVV